VDRNLYDLVDAARELLALADTIPGDEIAQGRMNGKLNRLRQAVADFPAPTFTVQVFGLHDCGMWDILSDHETLADAVAAAKRYDCWRVTDDDGTILATDETVGKVVARGC
jgi:hypothetical protein